MEKWSFYNTLVQHVDWKFLFNFYFHQSAKIAFTKIINSLRTITSNDCFSVITLYNLSAAFYCSLLDTLPQAPLMCILLVFFYLDLTALSQSPS